MITIRKQLQVFIFSILVLANAICYAEHVPLDVEKIMVSTGLDIDRDKLMASEILVFARADQESVDSQIALDMLLYVKAPYDKVVAELHKGENQLTDYPGAIAVEIDNPKTPKASFQKLHFTQDESAEVAKLFAYSKGDAYNLSRGEIARLRAMVNTTKKDKLSAATSFYKELLEQRLKEYQVKGIYSIPSYQHSGDSIEVSRNFKKGTENLTLLQNWFPLFYKDFLNYPKSSTDGYSHKFYCLKDGMDDRPVFILKHQMVKEEKNGTIIAERQFFISHGLDALQVEIICLPYKEGTIIGLGAQTFTEKVAGMGSFIAHKVGRYQMEKQIKPMFEHLQKKFSH